MVSDSEPPKSLRLVASVRCAEDPALGELGQKWRQGLGLLLDRATAYGGRIVSWSASGMAADFSIDALADAVDFLADAPEGEVSCMGLALGSSTTLLHSGRLALVSGDALIRAELLAHAALQGQVLIDKALLDTVDSKLTTEGEPSVLAPGLISLALKLHQPFARTQESDEASDFPEVGSATFRAEELALLARSAQAMEDSGLFPGAFAALDRGEGQMLGRSAAESGSPLESDPESTPDDEVVERLTAIAEIARGQSGRALSRLQDAKSTLRAKDASSRCRAALALAVGLAATGRPLDAVLEAVEGLASARRGLDLRGEHACCKFLVQLARALGDEESAQAWEARADKLSLAL